MDFRDCITRVLEGDKPYCTAYIELQNVAAIIEGGIAIWRQNKLLIEQFGSYRIK